MLSLNDPVLIPEPHHPTSSVIRASRRAARKTIFAFHRRSRPSYRTQFQTASRPLHSNRASPKRPSPPLLPCQLPEDYFPTIPAWCDRTGRLRPWYTRSPRHSLRTNYWTRETTTPPAPTFPICDFSGLLESLETIVRSLFSHLQIQSRGSPRRA